MRIHIDALLLAAGESKRFRAFPKALLRMWPSGPTLLEHNIGLLSRFCRRVHLVTAEPHGSRIRARIDKDMLSRVKFIHNPHPARGQFSSVLLGLSSVLDGFEEESRKTPTWSAAQAVMVHPVDQPLDDLGLIRALFSKVRRYPGTVCKIEDAHGRRGHPVFLPRRVMEQVVQYSCQETLRNILKSEKTRVIKIRKKRFPNLNTPAGFLRQYGWTPTV